MSTCFLVVDLGEDRLEVCGDDFGFLDGADGAVWVFQAVACEDADDFGGFRGFEVA